MRAAGLLLALLVQMAGGPPPQGTSMSGRVTDRASGQPLPRIAVSLIPTDRSKAVEVLTDADGRFQFRDVAPGKYGVLARNDEHRSTYLAQWFGDAEPADMGGFALRLNLEVAAGASRRDLDVALTRALAIEGHVVDPWDEPMSGAEVIVTGPNGSLIFAQPSVSDDVGVYRVYGLRPGRYHVCATLRERYDSAPPPADDSTYVRTCYPASATEAGAADVTLTVQDAANIDIRVRRAGTRSISGVVIDASGVAVDGANVSSHPVDESGSIVSDVTRGGSFVLKKLVPGVYTVYAAVGEPLPGDPNPPARTPEMGFASVDLTSTETAEIAIATSKGVDIRGTVTFEGAPPPRLGASRPIVQTLPPAEQRMLSSFDRYPSATVGDDFTFQLERVYRRPVLVRIQNPPDGWASRPSATTATTSRRWRPTSRPPRARDAWR